MLVTRPGLEYSLPLNSTASSDSSKMQISDVLINDLHTISLPSQSQIIYNKLVRNNIDLSHVMHFGPWIRTIDFRKYFTLSSFVIGPWINDLDYIYRFCI